MKKPVRTTLLLAASLLIACPTVALARKPKFAPAAVVRMVIDAAKPVNTITPDDALGAAIDGSVRGGVKRFLTPFNIEKMQSSGLRRVTYRTRAELGIEVWHWTEEGAWSDPAHQRGYWTGSDNPRSHPRTTWGYNLPRRGESADNANNVGYSRLDDGDLTSFWKSNPYLDRRYTGAAQSRPQWIVVSFDKARRIQAARIHWGAPFARHYLVQYWNGEDQFDSDGRWTTFAHGDVTVTGEPGEAVLRLAAKPILARYLRILLLDSSGTAPPGSSDIRDSLGYAVRELEFGVLDRDGDFEDALDHGKTRDSQTAMQVSSTDPWHRATDRDPDTEQPSLDFMFDSGLTGGLPMMVPVGTLFDTPENATAQVRYLRRRGYLVNQIELGEEADGQAISAEDYADLYLEVARAVHAADPGLSLGGPSLQAADTDTWPDPQAGPSWTRRFIDELKARGGLGELGFFSFENYAFDNVCGPLDDKLRSETRLLDRLMAKSAADGVPRTIPWIISEYGFSPFAGRAMTQVPSALLAADIVGNFFEQGGSAAYMFGYPPEGLMNQKFACAGYGNMMLFQADKNGQARWPMPVFYAEQLMLRDWGVPAGQPHGLYAASGGPKDSKGRPIIVAYPLRGADGHWSVMLINRDSARAYRVRLVLKGPEGERALGEGLSVAQYGPAQYQWLDRGADSHPIRDLPPARFQVGNGVVSLPAFSLTVVR